MSQSAGEARASDLAILASQIRECTLDLFEATTTDSLTWTPPGTSNHILWHAGHAVWAADVLTVKPLTGKSELPSDWAETFGQNSQPKSVRVWPDRRVVRLQLETQLKRVLDLFYEYREMIVERADEPPHPGSGPSYTASSTAGTTKRDIREKCTCCRSCDDQQRSIEFRRGYFPPFVQSRRPRELGMFIALRYLVTVRRATVMPCLAKLVDHRVVAKAAWSCPRCR